jgi:hypothetical protein
MLAHFIFVFGTDRFEQEGLYPTDFKPRKLRLLELLLECRVSLTVNWFVSAQTVLCVLRTEGKRTQNLSRCRKRRLENYKRLNS